MTTFTGTSGNDTANANSGTLTGFTGGTVADLQDDGGDTFISGNGVDVIFAGNAPFGSFNRIIGQGGADEMHGGSGKDVFNFNSGDVVAGEIIDGGGGGEDQILQQTPSADFTVATIISIEAISFLAAANTTAEAKFLASQFGGGGLSLNLHVEGPGMGAAGIVTIFMGDRTTLDLSGFDFGFNFDVNDFVQVIGDFSPEQIIGTSKADILTGNAGDDTLDGRGGADQMSGGFNNDIYIVDNSGDVVIEALDQGIDEIRTTLASFNLNTLANVENLTHTGSNNFTGIGTDGANVLIGGTGNDYLIGFDGNDTLIDGSGLNTLQGGKGDDIYAVQSNADTVFEFANEGIDQVQTFLASYALSDNVENLTFIGAVDHVGRGNNLANLIIGAGGNDTLLGGEGAANTLQGGAGNDIYGVEAAGDSIIELAGGGIDIVQTPLSSFTLVANVENLTHTGSSNFTGIGNDLKNVLIGGTGNDYLIGLDGDDTLIDGNGLNTLQGGKGNDTYAVQSNADTVFEFANEGIDGVQTFLASYVLSPNVENLTFIGSIAHTGTGNGLNNGFTGNSGNDTFTGGGGHDVFRSPSNGNGADIITDFDAVNASPDHDFIDLNGRFLNFNQLTLTSANGGTLIAMPGGDSIFLQNVAVGALDSGDFFFNG